MKRERSPFLQKGFQVTKEGFSLVEALLASATFVLFLTGTVGAYLYGQEAVALAGNRVQAIFLAQEGIEALRNMRDEQFSNLVYGTFGLAVTGNQWALSGSQDVSGIFTRQVSLSALDIETKEVTSQVSWQQNPQRTGTVTLVTRLTNWLAAGIAGWGTPSLVASLDLSGAQDGQKIQINGNYAYMIRASGTPNFIILSLSDPAHPLITGSLTLTGTPTDIFVAGNYAYISNQDNSQEFQIISLENPSAPMVVGSYNAPGGADARGVFVQGTIAYVVRASSSDREFLVLNVAIPSAPALLGSLDLGAAANEVVASGSYAYVASASDTQELQVVNIGILTSPTLSGSLNLSGSTNADTVALTGNTLLLGRGQFLYTVNVTTQSVPVLLGSVDVNGTVNDVALNAGNGGNYIFLATSYGSNEFQVVDISTPTLPTVLGTYDAVGNNSLFGIAYSQASDRAFLVGSSNAEEFSVIAPQP